MKKILLGIFIFISISNAKIIDSDLDGVSDLTDKCPNTPFLEIVSKNGCSKQQLDKIKKSKLNFNLSIGYEIDKYDDSTSNLWLASLVSYTKNYSIIYSLSSLEKKIDSSILSLYYKKFISKNIKLKTGVKTYFPTYYNDKIDYAFKIQLTYYSLWTISLSEKHKIYTETDTKDKDTLTFELGKTMNNLYFSPYIYTENSIYNKNKWYYYGGIFTEYSIKKYSLSLDLSTDLQNNSNISIVTALGYSF